MKSRIVPALVAVLLIAIACYAQYSQGNFIIQPPYQIVFGTGNSSATDVYVGNKGGALSSNGALFLGGNVVELSADTGNLTSASLAAIPGLAITLPAAPARVYYFRCDVQFTSSTGGSTVAFGIQGATNAPTNLNATGMLQTNTTSFSEAVSGTINSTTMTSVVSAAVTPTTAVSAQISGTVEAANPAPVLTLGYSVSAGNFVAKRGSSCFVI